MFQPSSNTFKSGLTYFAGALFGIGWFLWVDAHVSTVHFGLSNADHPDPVPVIKGTYYLPAIVSSVGLIMMNVINLETLNPYSWVFDESIGARVRIWLFLSFSVTIGGLVAAIWIMAAVYMPPNNKGDQYPGIALCLSNLCIVFSALFLLFTRSQRSTENYSEL
eukprot:TRINITY_DN461_c0_g1_i1.p1 TRINITY_DN461_c0_g1~~TRINITY_DN461_c0_g1_i1.p1  ORF type:complete len:164 (+),score=35.24 TRINITY_DN461_c0_g1_i1:117-608(+)